MPILAISLVAIVGMTGLVFDTSHVFVNKTRLQNAIDAATLAGAKVLDDTKSQKAARDAVRQVFDENLAGEGFGELRDMGLTSSDLIIRFSDTRRPFNAHPAATKYVKVWLYKGMITIDTLFMGIFGVDELDLTASAVAGPSPALGQVCNIIPTIVCGDPNDPPDHEGMYGYEYGDKVTLAMGSPDHNKIGPGNFQLLDLGEKGNDTGIREALAGGSDQCLSSLGSVETKPGVNRGPVAQGFNTRFGIYSGPVSATDYPPDLVTDAGSPNYPDTYKAYLNDYSHANYDYPDDGVEERRLLAVTFGNCNGTVNGSGTVPVLGFGCIFLNEPAVNNGALQTVQIFGELVRECKAGGSPGPAPIDGPGAHTIILYGDPDRWDS